MNDIERDDPRSFLTWRERALISEALAQELLNNPPGLAAAQAEVERLRRQLKIATDQLQAFSDQERERYPGEMGTFAQDALICISVEE